MTHEEAIAFLESLENSDEIKNPMALLETLRKANEEAKTNREKLEDAEAKLEASEKFRTGSKSVAISRELKAAGVKNPEKIVRLMNLENVSLDENGELKGFSEAFETTKTDWPELFDRKLNAPKVDQFAQAPEAKPTGGTALQIEAFRQANSV